MAEDLSGFSMLELFRLEAESQTAVLSAGVLAVEELERSPKTIEAMMRAAHSLKGAARIIGLEPAVRVAHAMEDCFVAAGRGEFHVRPEHVDLLLAAIDFLSSIARADDALAPDGPWPGRAEGLVERLGTLLASTSTGREAPAAGDAPAAPVDAPRPVAARDEPPPTPLPAVATPAIEAAAGADRAAAPEPPAARPLEQADRVVRVSADSLTRLVGLAGESLVETLQLRPFVDGLLTLRAAQVDLCDSIALLEEKSRAGDVPLPGPLATLLGRIREQADAGLASLARQAEEFESFARRNEDLSGRLHHEVIISRMRPLADGIRGFPRLVRDLARTLGKQIRWEVRGEQTGVDRPQRRRSRSRIARGTRGGRQAADRHHPARGAAPRGHAADHARRRRPRHRHRTAAQKGRRPRHGRQARGRQALGAGTA
jgi:two-component system sensor histidine kinase and response regulator WspE